MTTDVNAGSKEVLARLHHAMNEHDVAAFVACFGPAYRSEQATNAATSCSFIAW